MTGRLNGKVAFITGAARGQGRAHAQRLAREGADIIAVDLAGPLPGVPYESATPEDLAETVRLVESLDRRIVARQGDVRDLDRLRAVVEEGVAELGRLDVVVANAGICIPATWQEVTPEMFRDTLDINVLGVWNSAVVSIPHLIAAGGGSMILISSYAGKKMQPFMIPYTTSKHAVTGMTRALAAELGPHHIRVNSIHPGGVATPMGSGDMITRIMATNESNPKLAGMGTTFLPEPGTIPESISDAVAFLACDDSSFITAEHLSVDGGAQYF